MKKTRSKKKGKAGIKSTDADLSLERSAETKISKHEEEKTEQNEKATYRVREFTITADNKEGLNANRKHHNDDISKEEVMNVSHKLTTSNPTCVNKN
eukprot:CAMPEP_0168329186 /NCGR_PEP_ID=MMETSP0213-20121227/6958_1 /TAXON_ID=151035 /ORGANISM="Euplotes harpa, Strain FSP1.4" /LENGTH=96 /DNA_ID=CAMNT_0008332463 /DNA_START=751 /DNA_END=1041 /DNA_ORIENTATION=-